MSDKKEAFEQARADYKAILQERHDAGDTLTDDELELLDLSEKDPEPLPAHLHVEKPKAKRTPAQIKQAMDNIERINRERLQTGPTTEAGKRIASRNAIKLGIHAQRLMNHIRPCYKTCPEYPCALVQSGSTKPGSHCLEKHNFTASLDAIHDAMLYGDHKDFNGLLAVELAANLEVINTLRDHILISPLVLSIKTSTVKGKDDDHVITEQREYKANPALMPYVKLLADMGINMKEAMITPREIAKNKVEDKSAEALAILSGKAGKKLLSRQPDDEDTE